MVRGTIIFSLNIKRFAILFILFISLQALALSNHPVWVQNNLDKVDVMNDKDPSLALEFVQNFLNEKINELSPKAKAAIYSRLAMYHYYLGNIEESLKHVNLFYALNLGLGNSDGIALLLTHGGLFDEQGDSKKAMELYLQAESYAKETENKKLLAESYSAIASSFSNNHNDSEALRYYHQAYLHLKDLGDELEMAYLKIQMSSSYSYIYDDEKAISLAKEAITYFNQNEYYFDELFAQNSLANIYMTMDAYDTAIPIYEEIIELSKKITKTSFIEVAYLGLAKAYHHSKKADKARHYFSLYQSVHPSSTSPFTQIDDLMLSASIAFADKDIPLAEESIKQAEIILSSIDKESGLSWSITILDFNADLSVFKNDYQKAYQLQKKAREILKSYQSNEREKIRSKYKIMFDTDQALLKNQLLERDKLLDKSALENAAQQQKLQTVIIIVISIFVFVLVFFILKQRQTSKILHQLANTDTLTELANRRYTFIHAENMLALAREKNKHFAIIIFDIDHFKHVNDTYGHTGGDIALKDIAAIANEYVRSNDILGRIGGEEFLFILPNTSAKQAMEVAERVRSGIEENKVNITGNIVNITASFGVAELVNKKQSFNQIFHEADIALYKAKNNGRNHVVMAELAG